MEEDAIDCRKMGKDNYDIYKAFFNDDGKYRWTIRHATGKELAARGTAYNKQGKIEGVEDVYRYYRDVEPTADDAYATTDPEVTPNEVAKDKVKVGHIIGDDGKFYRLRDEMKGVDPMAMVVYLGGEKCVEKDKDWNALAIALKDVTKDGLSTFAFGVSGQDNRLCSTTIADEKDIANCLDGWAMTQRLKDRKCNYRHRHPGVEAMEDMDKIEGCSEWFIPSAGQWDLAMQGMGFGKYTELDEGWGYAQEGQWIWKEAGIYNSELLDAYSYMTTTKEDDGDHDSYYTFDYYDNVDGVKYNSALCTQSSRIRPFLAFKVGNGGSVNPEEPEE
jgi:hypothetical protein